MAIFREDPETGELRKFSNSEIKAQIKGATGWTETQYNREYAKFRNRLRNYEAATGTRVKDPANERLYRIIEQRQTTGLNRQNEVILSFSSASTRHFREQAMAKQLTARQEKLAQQGLVEGQFGGLLEKSQIIHDNYNRWLNSVVRTEKRVDPKTGEIIRTKIFRRDTVTAQDIRGYLANQAKQLHNRQWREYNANKARYTNRRQVGSD